MNNQINAPEIRLIDEEGQMIGSFSSREALRMAQDKGLDLIEIAPNAKPPTCKIMDYGKWKYENKKKKVAAKKKQSVVSIKEIQVRPRTEQHDLEIKTKHARRFLIDGDKVKINLRFSGREMAHQEIGIALLDKVTEMLGDVSIVESPPKKEGRQMFVLLAPDPIKIKDYKKARSTKPKKESPSTKLEAESSAQTQSQEKQA